MVYILNKFDLNGIVIVNLIWTYVLHCILSLTHPAARWGGESRAEAKRALDTQDREARRYGRGRGRGGAAARLWKACSRLYRSRLFVNKISVW